MRLTRLLSLGIATALFVVGCGGESGTVTPPATNQAPVASASADAAEVEAGTTVQLDGTASSDPDGDNLSYNWSLGTPSGSGATVSNASSASPTFVPDVEGDYVATLTVSDGQAEASDEVAVTAIPCPPELVDSDINEDTTFPDVCFATDRPDYLVSGTPDINAEVTIEAGVRMVFEEEAGFRVNDGGSILARGTMDAPVQMEGEEERPGYWRGIYFRGDDVTSELDYVFGEHGGHVWDGVDEAATIVVGNDASVSLTNSVIRGSSGSGVYLEPRAELAAFASNALEENGEHSVFLPDVQMGAMDSETSYGVSVLVYATVGIDQEMTVMPLSSSLDGPEYRMRGFFEVNAPVTLDPGVVLAFEEDGAIRVNDGGALLADGTEDRRIIFHRADGSTGPWRGILFRADDRTSSLDHVDVTGAASEPMLELDGNDVAASVMVDNDARLSITNTLVNGNRNELAYGLFLMPRATLTEFSGTAFVFFERAPVYIPDRQMQMMNEETDFSSTNSANHVLVYPTGGIDDPMTISPLEILEGERVRYRLDGSFEVNASVTIEPDVWIEFDQEAAMRVNDGGALLARGTAQDSIVMTGVEEVAGSWRGILFRADDKPSELDNVWIGYGGGEVWAGAVEPANLTLEDTNVSLTNSTIAYSAGWGVWLDSSLSEFGAGGNTYESNASGSVGQRE